MMWAMTESHSGCTQSGIIPSSSSHSWKNEAGMAALTWLEKIGLSFTYDVVVFYPKCSCGMNCRNMIKNLLGPPPSFLAPLLPFLLFYRAAVLFCCSAIVLQFNCAAVLLYCSAIVLLCCSAIVLHSAIVLLCCSAVVLQCYCFSVPLCCSAIVLQY